MSNIKIAAATMLAAAGAVVAGALGAAAPANAQVDKFVAISYSPETGSYGWGNNYDDLDSARIRSLSECQNFGGNHCVFLAWSKNWVCRADCQRRQLLRLVRSDSRGGRAARAAAQRRRPILVSPCAT